MSICDPVNGMHSLFAQALTQHHFAPAPHMGFDLESDDSDIQALETQLAANQHNIAAIAIEPIVQGAGGMRFYRPDYLTQLRKLCDQYDVLLIADEIATGFGRTGKLFACEWANITPDIMTLGKTLTGGHISLAATLAVDKISQHISHPQSDTTPNILAHGPTFMANPLACAAAIANIDVLLASPWQQNIARIEKHFTETLLTLKNIKGIKDARVLGAIGVIELERDDLGAQVQAQGIKNGIWLRPFGRLVYMMPAYNMADEQLAKLTSETSKIAHLSFLK